MPILELYEIKKSFGQTIALDGVNLSLRKGEVHALIGENGAGKSTLMNVISGAFRADSGVIEIDGLPYVPEDPLDVSRQSGYVDQITRERAARNASPTSGGTGYA